MEVRMDTIVKMIPRDQIEEDMCEEAITWLQKGELVAFPMETVYCLGGDALDPEAAKKIY